ncbi:glutathione S-transferase theta-1a [Salarias fasciatus]|uniref:glutathione transferase n=1 Tax=Salarias fasciatus TaxID=181472 RepID=A0A672J3G5_SALFA|nr:glutathione S-transferase theta-3-like [Salarias fasciatus]
MELYLDLLSQPCRSVYMFAKLLKIPFDYKKVDLAAGQQYGEEFGKISMVRRVPVLKEGTFVLTESTAILQYLAQKHKGADHWYPADLQRRARVQEYLAWQHTGMRAHGSKVFILRCLYPLVLGSEAPQQKMDDAVAELKQSLDLLENFFLQNRPFIAGDKISVADLVAIVEIMQPVGSGFDVFADRPKLTAWRDAVKKEVGDKLFDEAHEGIMNAKEAVKRVDKARLEQMKPYFLKM